MRHGTKRFTAGLAPIPVGAAVTLGDDGKVRAAKRPVMIDANLAVTPGTCWWCSRPLPVRGFVRLSGGQEVHLACVAADARRKGKAR